ncbi:MAG: serine/threonine-protein kinase [Gemmataceae bacterium]
MATPTTLVADYLSVLAKSKLVSDDVISSYTHTWKGRETDVEGLRKHLVAKKYLTEYQSVMISRGHTDGYQIGGYVVQDRIGKGQSAGVYLCRHASGQVVALKVLPKSKARNPNVLGRFQREGRLLTQLNQANIVRAFQIGMVKEIHFIAMEHLDGETLDEILARRKKLPVAEACRLADQLLDGLEHLHENRMIHRDVKPANLMVVPAATAGKADNTLNATLKLVDIGLGRELFAEEDASEQDLNLTREGAIIGTPDYFAPEQARDARTADIRSDIYSAGCVLFQMITGRPPFVGKNVMAQVVKHATEPSPRIVDFIADAPRGLQLVLDKMLAKNPADRYQTPFEAAEALQLFLPEQNNLATETSVLPAFQNYLVSESQGNPPLELLPEPPKPVQPSFPVKLPKKSSSSLAVRPVNRDHNVEIIALPDSTPPTQMALPVHRHPFVLNRRDWVMLAIGFFICALAIICGYGLSFLLKK